MDIARFFIPIIAGKKAVFSPLDLLPKVWLKSDTGFYADAGKTTPVTTNNTVVDVWTDQSGNGLDVVSDTGKMPKLMLNVINGHAVLRFDAADDWMASAVFASALSQPNTVFIVLKHNSGSVAGAENYIGSKASAVNANNFAITNGTPDSWNIYAGTTLDSGVAIDTNVNIFTLLFNGASSTIRQNGVEIAAGNANTKTMGSLSLGYGGAEGVNSDIAEVIVYNSNLSDVNRAKVEGYLTTKFINP